MNHLRTLLLLLASCAVTAAQTNTFPSSGSVGIGTTSPGALLHVQSGTSQYANAVIQSGGGAGNGYAAYLQLRNTDSDWSMLRLSDSGSGTTFYAKPQTLTLSTSAGVPFQINTNGTYNNGLFVDTSGYVGIGTTTPGATLELFRTGGGSFLKLNDSFSGGDAWAINSGITGVNNAGFEIRDLTNSIDRFVIDSSGNVGIGTASPAYALDIYGTNKQVRLGTTSADSYSIIRLNNSGNAAAFIGLDGAASSLGVGGSALLVDMGTSPFYITKQGAAKVMVDTSGNVGIGTTNPAYKLAVNGVIRAKEVIVDTGWSDYVFDESYKPKSLSETEAYIKAEHHLPGIPSAQDVAEHGVSMGEMQSRLLAKIEELTLHQIEQEKQLKQQQNQLRILKQQNEELLSRLKP